jgi:ribosomal-protein-alanine N-acetyltransferase
MMILQPVWPPEQPKLASARIYLRPPIDKDNASWRNVRRSNMAHLQPYEPQWPEGGLSDSFFRRRLRYQQKEWFNDRNYSLLVMKGDDDTIIGGMNINNVSRGAAQFASLGYWIDKDHVNQGYMGEVMALSLKFCFSFLKLERVNAATLVDNLPSQRVLTRAGFAEEGLAKGYIQINGLRADHKLYGLNKADWRAQNS